MWLPPLSTALGGILFFGELYPRVEGFFFSGEMGQVTLPTLSALPYGLVLFLVVLMALGGFYGAGAVERLFGRKAAEASK